MCSNLQTQREISHLSNYYLQKIWQLRGGGVKENRHIYETESNIDFEGVQ